MLDPAPSGQGITEIRDSYCRQRNDIAYRLASDAMLQRQVRTEFPSGFPGDYSVLITARPRNANNAALLGVSTSVGRTYMSIETGENLKFTQQDGEASFNGTALRPGQWSRFSFAVRGNQVTLYMDCRPIRTLPLVRGNGAELRDGPIVIGRLLQSAAVYLVSDIYTSKL